MQIDGSAGRAATPDFNPWLARCLILCLLVSVASTARADIFGKVVDVIDGDTIRVLDHASVEHKVRLAGIDAPERGQPFARASRDHLVSLVAGDEVRVETTQTDRYGRLLGKVWAKPGDCPDCGQTLDVNLVQIRSGMAWWYEFYSQDQPAEDRESYRSAVGLAKSGKLGLWSEPDPIPPWAWRRGQRTQSGRVAAESFRCGAKRYCREMASCEEARFYLRECGRYSLDGNRDGVPCESLCR